ncbi:hypothetical protein [Thermococcus barophilus]|uniref:Uncharacterized protein n=1 Tax=Thermococcus barophilus (strain DSM 11836 / MP) TaxID=391623 RepID=F0LIZ7_THEBM|nr:hypothetical protein [Thermococcus barophilus]ADT83343.1 hypothetical protein TERMP_00366 [Thermococcus barophilus MP]
MDEYLLIRGLVSLILILSVFYTGMVFKMLGQYMEKGKRVVFVQMIGSLLVVLASVVMGLAGNSLKSVFAIFAGIIGAFLIIHPLFRYRLIKFSKINVTQVVLVLLSSAFGHFMGLHGIAVLKTTGILSLLLLVQSLRSIKLADPLLKILLDVSLWLLVVYAWLYHLAIRYIGSCNYYLIYLIYFTALLLWFFSAVITYEHLRRWL